MSSLLLKISMQNTQTLQLFTINIKTEYRIMKIPRWMGSRPSVVIKIGIRNTLSGYGRIDSINVGNVS